MTAAYFWYDGLNRQCTWQINGNVTLNVWDGWDLAEEYKLGNILDTSYLHGAATDEIVSMKRGAQTWFFLQNTLGSTSQLVDPGGNIVENYKYDPHGQVSISDAAGNPRTVSAYANRFLFTGREYYQELGLYNYRNRFYSPALGRFLQTDPMGFAAGDTNLFRYCGGDPVNRIDPSGLVSAVDADSKPKPPDGSGGYAPTGTRIPLAGGSNLFDPSNFPLGFSSSNGWGSGAGGAPGGGGGRRGGGSGNGGSGSGSSTGTGGSGNSGSSGSEVGNGLGGSICYWDGEQIVVTDGIDGTPFFRTNFGFDPGFRAPRTPTSWWYTPPTEAQRAWTATGRNPTIAVATILSAPLWAPEAATLYAGGQVVIIGGRVVVTGLNAGASWAAYQLYLNPAPVNSATVVFNQFFSPSGPGASRPEIGAALLHSVIGRWIYPDLGP